MHANARPQRPRYAARMSEPPPPPAWDERYAEPGWAFGSEPNDFLGEHAGALPARGRVLTLAEGEGRNAVWLAQQGFEVTGVDLSAVGLEKAERLAAERGVRIITRVADLERFDPGEAAWDGIVSIFAHLPAEVRRALHARLARALRPGGVLLLEAYTPSQIERGTGGPSDAGKLMTLAGLRDELAGLTIVLGRELERDVIEGRYHTGRASVVQVVARREA